MTFSEFAQRREALLLHVKQAASDIGINLVLGLTDVQFVDGKAHVTATCDIFPFSETVRSMLRSSLHVAILHGLENIEATVVVHTLPVLRSVAFHNLQSLHASTWISSQIEGINHFATRCAETWTRALLEHVINAYPWRNADSMRQMVPVLCLRAISNLTNMVPEPLMQGNVDIILPQIKDCTTPDVLEAVRLETMQRLNRSSVSLLETYETVFASVQKDSSPPRCCSLLYVKLFMY